MHIKIQNKSLSLEIKVVNIFGSKYMKFDIKSNSFSLKILFLLRDTEALGLYDKPSYWPCK